MVAFREPATWPDKLTQQWKVDVGLGYSAPIIVGNRVYSFARQEPNEILRAHDAETGKVVWETSYAAPFKPNPAATRKHGTGPKSTPTFANGKLFTLGMSGIVTAFDAATGKQLWQKPAPPVEPLYHTAMSPLVDRGLVIVHVGGHNNGALTAFEANTGAIKWAWTGDGPAYGSPIVAELAGVRQVITLTQENLIGVAAETGELLWRRPFAVRATRNAVTPIVFGQTVIVSGLEKGVTAFTRAPAGQRDRRRGRLGERRDHDGHEHRRGDRRHALRVLAAQQRAVLRARRQDRQDAVAHRRTRRPRTPPSCAPATSGWRSKTTPSSSIARANRSKFEPLRRYTVADSATWAQPVISGAQVYVKDISTITRWALR